ncbi:MAG: NAD-dependent epimerase/dehydratase family protein [Planctomycetia bacterium]|nr:NAD-dependent epimerase/dehydratase family protein [Planctomycetia bacterium]
MRIFITGICGFVGSALALRLRERWTDAEIFGLDNLSRHGSEVNPPRLRAAGIRVHHGDVRQASDFETLPECDFVIDAAANPSVLAGVDGRTSSRQLVEHNLLGTVNVLEYARTCGAGVVLLSTSRVYSIAALAGLPLCVEDEALTLEPAGPLPPGCSQRGIAEEFSTAAPVSLYGATKLASETLALEYAEAFDLPIVVNRCSVLAGPEQFGVAEQGIFSFWVRAYALKRPLRYIGFGGLGHQVRDALAVDDLAELVALQMQEPHRAGGIWNVGGGPANAMSLAQLSRWCADEFGPHAIDSEPTPRPFDVPWVVLDSGRALAELGWRPRVPIRDILGEIAAHHRQHPDWLDRSRPA